MSEEKTEADYAWDYSEEYRMRMKCEERLHGLMWEIIPFITCVREFVEAVIQGHPSEAADFIKTLTMWSGDIQANLYLNIFNPAGPNEFYTNEQKLRMHSLGDGPRDVMIAMEELMKKAAKKNAAHWDQMSGEMAFLDCAGLREKAVKEVKALIRKIGEDQNDIVRKM